MRKILLIIISAFFAAVSCIGGMAKAAEQTLPEPVIKMEIPASEIDKIDIKYENKTETGVSKALKETKTAAEKAADNTKEFTEKTVNTTKNAAKKSVKTTKRAANKAANAAKNAADKTITATKDAAKKSAGNTKDIIDNINPNKPVTKEGLKADADIRTLKNERNELKSAYNSRIKDVDAKIKATEKYTDLTEAQKNDRIYKLNKEKALLEREKAEYTENYNNKIEKAKEKKRKSAE